MLYEMNYTAVSSRRSSRPVTDRGQPWLRAYLCTPVKLFLFPSLKSLEIKIIL